MRKLWNFLLIVLCPLSFMACGNSEEQNSPDDGNSEAAKEYTGMSGARADVEYSVVTIKKTDGAMVEVDINGLEVEAVKGAVKNEAGEWHIVERRGVRFDKIFAKGGITADDLQPVTFVCRDGYDVFRTKLKNDADKLPEFKWLGEKGYVYPGSGGSKDPLYPLHEGKALNVDYDLSGDAEVPANIGNAIAALSNLRASMIEKVDAGNFGVVELVATTKE